MHRNVRFTTAAVLLASLGLAGAPAWADHHGGEHKDKKTAKAAPTQNVVEIAQANEDFSTLVKALGQARLVEALAGEGPFTVFAPTDEAFAKLPEGTLDSLMKPENREQLVEVLKYHVVPQKLMAEAAAKAARDKAEVKTLQGSTLGFYSEDDKLKVSGASIVKTDIAATNGVIHVIDTVLLPQEKSDSADSGTGGM